MKEGLRFVFRQPIVRSTMLLDFFATFFSSANQLLPIFAAQILQVGAIGYGLLTAASAIGSLIAGSAMGFITRIRKPGAVILWSVAIYGVATLAVWHFAVVRRLAVHAGGDGRVGHGQHDLAPDDPASGDAR